MRVLVFLLSSLILFYISVLFTFFLFKLHPYYSRSERDIADKQHSTDRTISSTQIALGIIK